MTRIFDGSAGTATKIALGILSLLGLTMRIAWSAENYVGFVLDVTGECYLGRSNESLEVGQGIPAGSIVHFPPQHGSSNHVEIALRDGTKISVHCDEAVGCDTPIRATENSVRNPIIQAILDSILPQQRKYVIPITRGIRPPREVILKLTNCQIDPSPIFENAKQGEYELELNPIPLAGVSGSSSSITISVAWSPENLSLLNEPRLRTGLFEASVPQAQIDEVWVLIATPADFKNYTKRLEEARQLTRRWQLGIADQHEFLRTYLVSLASKTDNSASR
jgi:hypothetical protein